MNEAKTIGAYRTTYPSNPDIQPDRWRAVLGVLPLTDGTLLDAGCGFGGLSAVAREMGFRGIYTGVDLVEHHIATARERFPGEVFQLGDVLALPDASFDHVIAVTPFDSAGYTQEDVPAFLDKLTRVARRDTRVYATFLAEAVKAYAADVAGTFLEGRSLWYCRA